MELFVPRSYTKERTVQQLKLPLLARGFLVIFIFISDINIAEEWQSLTKRGTIAFTVIFAILVTLALFAAVLTLLEKRAGILVCEETLFQVSLTKKVPIDTQEIAAVKIARAEVVEPNLKATYLSYVSLSSKDGTPLYSMFLLRQCDDATLRHSSGDEHFYLFRRKYIIEKCIYNQAIIDFLTARNPNLLIIPPEGIQPEPEPRKPGPVQGRITRVTPKDRGFH